MDYIESLGGLALWILMIAFFPHWLTGLILVLSIGYVIFKPSKPNKSNYLPPNHLEYNGNSFRFKKEYEDSPEFKKMLQEKLNEVNK
jgi:hypothetical protein